MEMLGKVNVKETVLGACWFLAGNGHENRLADSSQAKSGMKPNFFSVLIQRGALR